MQNHNALKPEGAGTGFVKSMVGKDCGALVHHELNASGMKCCFLNKKPVMGSERAMWHVGRM
jgi:hypothetical protein